MTVRERAAVFRFGETPRERFWWTFGLFVIAVCGVGIVWVFGPLPKGPMPNWSVLGFLMAGLGGMMTIGMLIAPRGALRISDRGVSRVTTWPCRRRTTISWDDVTSVRDFKQGRGIVALESGRCELELMVTQHHKQSMPLIRDELFKRLKDRFDFDVPTRADLRKERIRNWSLKRQALDKAFAVLMGALCCVPFLSMPILSIWWPQQAKWLAPLFLFVLLIAFMWWMTKFGIPMQKARTRRFPREAATAPPGGAGG